MHIGKSKLLLLVCIALLLLVGMTAFLHSPVGITRLRIQNNLFRVLRITVTAEEGGFRDVTQSIEVRNLFPWTITVDRVGFHSKGEYSMLWSDMTADAPFPLGSWETREISVTYRFDEARAE